MNDFDLIPTSDTPTQVLLIEDSQVDRLVLRSILEAAGFQVRDTGDVASAIGLLKLEHVDVVVSDVGLPMASGIDLLAELSQTMPNLPVVLVTASESASVAAAAVHHHAFDYLLKPVPRETLVAAVSAAAATRSTAIPRAMTLGVPQAAARPSPGSHDVLEFLPSAVLVLDAQGQVLVMNRLAEELLDATRPAVLGQSYAQLASCPEFRDFLAGLVDGSAPDDKQIVHVQAKDGTTRILGCSVTPLTKMTGAPTGTRLIHFQDITQKVRMETAMIQADKLASLGTMAGALAHDINNPLSVVLGTLGIVLEDLGETQPELTRSLQVVERHTWMLVDIVRNFLKLSRSGRSKSKPVLLDHVLSDILALLGKQLTAANVTVRREIDPELPPVEGSETQFQQILLNLIVNARDAMAQGGCLTLRGRHEGPNVVIEVSDTGPGIPPEVLAHIFETFFTTKEPGKGTGLGLAICRSLTQEHGGSLNVSSQPGKGATFTLRFPAASSSRKTAISAADEPQPKILTRSLNVLVVDDEQPILEVYRRMLVRAGCRGAYYTNPRQALKEFTPGCFELALLDIRMPQMDGIRLAEALLAVDRSLVVVFVSGAMAAEVDNDLLQQSGAMGYIEKPFRPHSLNKWLELASRRHAARIAGEGSSVRPRIYRVLVVGDEGPCRTLRTGLEATSRFKVETAHTAPSALATVQARPPDLILLDFMAKAIDGLEVCRSLKTDSRTAGVPVVHYSETGGAEGMSRAEQAGAGSFLTAPAAPRVVALELLARLEGDSRAAPRGDV